MSKAAKGFETFRVALFGGYKKDDVIDYIDLLLKEMEEQQNEKTEMEQKWKEELEKKTESVSQLTEMLEEALEKVEEWKKQGAEGMSEEEKAGMHAELEKLKRENDELQKRNESLEDKIDKLENKQVLSDRREEEYRKIQTRLEEERKMYEKRSAAVSDVLTDARIQADHILEEAQKQADTAIKQTEESIELQRKAADRVYQNEVGKSIEQLMLVRLKMSEYLDMLDEVHSGIEKVYGSMSRVTAGIPTNVDMIRSLAEESVDEGASKEEKGTEDGSIKRIEKEN